MMAKSSSLHPRPVSYTSADISKRLGKKGEDLVLGNTWPAGIWALFKTQKEGDS